MLRNTYILFDVCDINYTLVTAFQSIIVFGFIVKRFVLGGPIGWLFGHSPNLSIE